MREKRQIFHAENSKLCDYSTLKEGSINFPLIKYELHVVTPFQRGQSGKEGKE